jgi:hypothetical protein
MATAIAAVPIIPAMVLLRMLRSFRWGTVRRRP